MTGGCRGEEKRLASSGAVDCAQAVSKLQEKPFLFVFVTSVAKLAANVFSREASVPKKRRRRSGVRYLLLRGTHYASNPDVHPNRHSLLPMRAEAS